MRPLLLHAVMIEIRSLLLRLDNRPAGGVVEWFKAAVLKTAVPGDRDRGFESHLLRQTSHCFAARRRIGVIVNDERIFTIAYGFQVEML